MVELQGDPVLSHCNEKCLFSFISGLTDKDRNNNHRQVIFRKGETIFKQGTFISKLIFIRKGLIKTCIEGSNGKDLIVKIYRSGEHLGITGVYGRNESKFTAIAMKETHICMVEINYFKKVLESDIGLNQKLLELCMEEHNFLFYRLNILGTKNLHGRLADALLYLAQEPFFREHIYNNLTRKELAELSAMSVESMIRLLNEFKNDKIITVNGKSIEINNRDLINILSKSG